MKKNYMRPESKVVIIEIGTLLTGSPNDITVNTDNGSSVNAGEVDSRQYDDWDD